MKSQVKIVHIHERPRVRSASVAPSGFNGRWWLLSLGIGVALWSLAAWGAVASLRALHAF